MADAKYTVEQFGKFIDNLFAKHDLNKDEKLDHAETKAAMVDAHERFGEGKPFNDEAFEAAFLAMDTNKDGNIQRQELYDFLLKVATSRGRIE